MYVLLYCWLLTQILATDIIVYGASPAGIICAVTAAAEGHSVLLIDPREHLGGMVAGGLSISDVGTTTAVLGGRALQFFKEVGRIYGLPMGMPQWNFEPKIATEIFKNMINSAGSNLTTKMNVRLVSLQKNGTRIMSATDENNNTYSARVWVDCSYEGYLLPLAGVEHTWGREATDVYNESVAGVIPEPFNGTIPGHLFESQPQLPKNINAFWPNGTLIPLIQTQSPGKPWTGDNRTQSYNFRITLTNDSSLRVPFPKPSSYDPTTFELFRRAMLIGNWSKANDVIHSSRIANSSKFDCNIQLMDWIGENWDYPHFISTNDWQAQNSIWQRHLDLSLGFLWYFSHDPSVFPSIREDMQNWGLPSDEFYSESADMKKMFPSHFPPQLYVREALRMVGSFVFTQTDRELNVTKEDSIGMGAYTIDILHVSRYHDPQYGVLMEGGIQAPAFLPSEYPPFQIPYRALLPRQEQCSNMLVPVAVSASHIGFCSIRLEPTWMVLGESAGVAASFGVREDKDMQNLVVTDMQARLRQLGQILAM